MSRSGARAALGVLLGVMCAVGRGDAEESPYRVGIRLSHEVEVPQWALVGVQDVVARVYARAGVEVLWEGQRDGPSPRVQLTVILTAQTPVDVPATRGVLAVAILPDIGSGRIAYVVWPRVAAFARTKRVQAPNVLGRVIAHEAGHLLLGHNAHSGEGIMRAHWDRRDFAGVDNHAVFSPEQSAQIREHLMSVSRIGLAR